jgi:hypothetical protein
VARELQEQVARRLVSCLAGGKSKALGDPYLDKSDKAGRDRIYTLRSEVFLRKCAIASRGQVDNFAILDAKLQC